MMIRPSELDAIKAGTVDLAFRRWDRPRVKVGTQLRTAVGVLEVLAVDRVTLSSLRASDATRAGAASLAALKEALNRSDAASRPIYRVQLRHAGEDPRTLLRTQVPDAAEISDLAAWMGRLDAASADGPWTHDTLRCIDQNPEVRAPELAEALDRPTLEFKRDVRKLKEKGLTESLAIGYRLSPRGEAVWDALRPEGPRTNRPPRREGIPLPRNIGAPATRALRSHGLHTLQEVAGWRRADLAALHGVGPIALDRLDVALAQIDLTFAP